MASARDKTPLPESAVDETYIRVGGKWCYLWRAIDANGQLVDFRLTANRDAKAAKAFLNKAIERVRSVSYTTSSAWPPEIQAAA